MTYSKSDKIRFLFTIQNQTLKLTSVCKATVQKNRIDQIVMQARWVLWCWLAVYHIDLQISSFDIIIAASTFKKGNSDTIQMSSLMLRRGTLPTVIGCLSHWSTDIPCSVVEINLLSPVAMNGQMIIRRNHKDLCNQTRCIIRVTVNSDRRD